MSSMLKYCHCMKSDFFEEIILKNGEKVVLRCPKLEDAKAFANYINGLIEEDTFISSKPQTEEDERSYISSMLKKISQNKEIHLVVFSGEEKIGAVDIFNLGVRKEHSGELQIHIRKDFRGIGLGKILLMKVFQLAKEELSLKMVMLTVFNTNTNALSLYEKLGFVKYGELPKAIYYKGEYINEILMYKTLE